MENAVKNSAKKQISNIVQLGAKLNAFPLRNSDHVAFSGLLEPPSSGTTDFTISSLGTSYLSLFKGQRITGNGTVSSIKIYLLNVEGITRLDIVFWRFDGTNYDEIGRENITSKLIDGLVIIPLSTDIALQEGDFIGFYGLSDASATARGYLQAQNGGLKYRIPDNYEGDNQSFAGAVINYKLIINCLSQAPLIVGIGDSIMESYPLHTSMVDVARTTVSITKSWMYKLHQLNNKFIYQDCGIGNESTSQIEARFNRDVVAKKPRFAVINGGVNDIATSVAKTTFLAKWTSILDMCVAANIIPVVWKIMPWTDGTNTQMQARDEWNTDLVTLLNSYDKSKWIIIDWDADFGQNRATGDVGNLWDIKTAYDQDGVHFNEAGQAKIAEVVLREIGKKYRL